MKLFNIRQEQIDALKWQAQKELRGRYIARLRKMSPSKTGNMSDQELHEFCDSGVSKASHYSLTTEANVYILVAAMLLLGSDFDTKPENAWAPDILGDAMMDQDIKAKLIHLRVLMETKTDVLRNG
jgi:hypothetical protein